MSAVFVAAALTWVLGHPEIVRGGAYPLATAGLCLGWAALGTLALRALGAARGRAGPRRIALGALALVVIGTGASAHLPGGDLLHALRTGIAAAAGGDERAANLVWESGHVITFALLAGALGGLRRQLRLERATLLAGLVGLALATEALQRHLPDRTPAASDLMANLAGIALGLACVELWRWCRYGCRPAQRRFYLRSGVDRRRRPRLGDGERRRRRSIGYGPVASRGSRPCASPASPPPDVASISSISPSTRRPVGRKPSRS